MLLFVRGHQSMPRKERAVNRVKSMCGGCAVACLLAVTQLASAPAHAAWPLNSGLNVSSRFPGGVVDLVADSSHAYLIGGGGALGRVSLQDKTLDPSWGVDTSTPFDKGWPRKVELGSDARGLTDVALDARGRVLQYGWIGTGFAELRPFLTRTFPNGDVDSRFASKGIRMMRGYGNSRSGGAISGKLGLDRRQRIYQSVERFRSPTASRGPLTKFTVVRLRRNGEVDRSYGKSGSAVLAIDQTRTQRMHMVDLAVRSDGQIAALMVIPGHGVQVRSFTPAGKLDKPLTRATRWMGDRGKNTKAVSIEFLKSGELLVVSAKKRHFASVKVALANRNGAPRAAFSGDGRLRVNDTWMRNSFAPGVPSIKSNPVMAAGASVDSRGRIILSVGGPESDENRGYSIALRITPEGRGDRSFASQGTLVRYGVVYPRSRVLPVATVPNGLTVTVGGLNRNRSESESGTAIYLTR